MEMSLTLFINIKKYTNTAYSRRIFVQYISKNTLQYYNGYFTNFYKIKAFENKEVCKFMKKIAFLVYNLEI